MAGLNLELRAMLEDLSDTVLDTDDIDRLIERIGSDDASLTRADFSYQSPNLSALAQALRGNQHLQQLILQGVDLRGSIDALCASLRGNGKARLQTLDLSFANLDVPGLVRVFEVVTATPALVEVVVMGNPGADNAMSMRLKRLLDINRAKSSGAAPLSPTSSANSTPRTSPPQSPTSSITAASTASTATATAATTAPTSWGEPKSISKTIISSFSRSNSSDLNSGRTSSPSTSSTTSTGSKKKKKDKDSPMSSSTDDDKKKKKKKGGRDKDQQLRVSLLEKRVAELEASERDLLAKIQEMEQASVHGSVDGRMSRKISSIISKKSQADKKMTISFRNVVVTERLASVGGSNAGVFSCYVDGWQCAMKELDIENIDDMSLSSFEGEIRLLELLPPHTNIVRYLYHERIEGKLRLYMTKYAGSLGSRLRELRKLVDAGRGSIYSAKAIAKYCLDIAQGISFLHQHQIVHRDLKSDNIFVMLNERKDIHHLAIADFDTAKQVTKAELAKTCIGTPQWMAPEVMTARHDTEYGFEVDIYSFGLVLYELLTVKIPYEDTPPFQIAPLVMQGKKPPLPALPEAYDGLIAIYEKCTQLNPASRPSASELKEMFVALL